MNKLFIQFSKPNTQRLNRLSSGPEQGVEQAQTSTPAVLETPTEFIARHNKEASQRVGKIPVDPRIKDLCHDRIGTLITKSSNPEYQVNQAQIESQITECLNTGESQQPNTPQAVAETKQPQAKVETQRVAIQQALKTYLSQVVETLQAQAQVAQTEAAGDETKMAYAQNLGQRGDLISAVSQSVTQNGIDWTNEVSFEGGNNLLLSQAKGTIGTQEGGEASALVGLDTANIPWCGAFVKAMCEKSGKPLPQGANWNVAEAYVNPSGQTGQHVAIYAGNGEMVGGNQSNAVTKTSLPGNYRFNTVENLLAGKQTDLSGQQEPQPGDIIVTSRGNGNSDTPGSSIAT